MNTIDLDTIKAALIVTEDNGRRYSALGELELLREYLLGDQSGSQLSGRIAPCLITRAELELFGVAYPRFCYRIYLDSEKTIFVNARRLADLQKQVGDKWANRVNVDPKFQVPGFMPDVNRLETPFSLIGKTDVIADAVLRKPSVENKFHILVAPNLHLQMGEADKSESKNGTPFSKSIPLAGACAQAVIHMASALLSEHAKGIFALAEISALMSDNPGAREKRELLLTGMRPPEIASFFQHPRVGLAALYQTAAPSLDDGAVTLRRSIRAYLRSGFPVVVPVDQTKLNVLDAYTKGVAAAYLKKFKRKLGTDVRHHSVLVVGCSKDTQSDEFLINDPSALPFMEVLGSELFGSREESSQRTFVPVTPGDINVPLDDIVMDSEDPNADVVVVRGLKAYVSFLQQAVPDGTDPSRFIYAAPRIWSKFGELQGVTEDEAFQESLNSALPALDIDDRTRPTEGDFWLIQLQDLVDIVSDKPSSRVNLARGDLQLRKVIVKELLNHMRSGSGSAELNPTRWYWLQLTTSSAWLWKAEMPSEYDDQRMLSDFWKEGPSASKAIQLLVAAVGAKRNIDSRVGQQRTAYPVHSEQPNQSPDSEIEPATQVESGDNPDIDANCIPSMVDSQNVKRGAITSFCANGFLRAMEALQTCEEVPDTLEVYAFMIGDLEWLKGHAKKRQNNEKSVYEFCAAMEDCKDFAENVANGIVEELKKLANPPLISGLASYLPEIADLGAHVAGRRLKAVRAIKTFITICGELQRNHAAYCASAHPMTLEIVAGSLVDGIWPAQPTVPIGLDGDVYVANRTPALEVLEGLFKDTVFCEINEKAEKENVRVAIELEPGPLYAINEDKKTLERLGEKLNDLERWYGYCRIGLNLDISHYILAGISPKELKDLGLEKWVYHSHLSRHTLAHWCDLPLGRTRSERQDFSWMDAVESWVKYLSELSTSHSFDGIISVEAEAAQSVGDVGASLRSFRKLVDNDRNWNEPIG